MATGSLFKEAQHLLFHFPVPPKHERAWEAISQKVLGGGGTNGTPTPAPP